MIDFNKFDYVGVVYLQMKNIKHDRKQIFLAGTKVYPSAWEDKKNPSESRFPAQVQIITR
ncbi:hypothetical protein Hanom_Chr11g01020971 [Helianthus anomalus]